MNEADLARARAWIGRSDRAADVLTERLAASFRATFAPHLHGDGLLGIHWCLAPEIAPMAQLRADGHPELSGSMPPAPLPRRMWASGQTQFHDGLRIGDAVTRTMTIEDVSLKTGKTGALLFVECRYDFTTHRGPAITEHRTVVYREPAAANPEPQGSPEPAAHSIEIVPSAALLFRYSALTFNTHRIHYDADYARAVENYPGLVIHGPLQATLALNACANVMGASPAGFTCRALAPLILGAPFQTKANRDGADGAVAAFIENAAGGRTFSARAIPRAPA